MSSLLFSTEDMVFVVSKRISNLDLSDHRKVFYFAVFAFKSLSHHLWMAQQTVFVSPGSVVHDRVRPVHNAALSEE